LKRRGQIPDAKYTPRNVCSIILKALQNNDEPQLDHGACVALEFKSPNGVLASEGLDPAGLGLFLRKTEYSSLIDFKSFEFVGQEEMLKDSCTLKQTIQIINYVGGAWVLGVERPRTVAFDFYLSKVDDLWLLDAILIQKQQ
jgi:hypothetical protein